MLNTDLKLLAKVLANFLKVLLLSLIVPEHSCAVKGRSIQNNLHLIRLIKEQVDSEVALINLLQYI